MEFHLLGPLEVLDQGRPLALGGRRQRALLADLLVHANEPVATDRLIEELWPDEDPDRSLNALQAAVSRLRKCLSPDLLLTRPPGYLLRVDPERLDRERFERLAAAGRQALASGDWATASTMFSDALALWRGPALADFAYERFAQPETARLDELRIASMEERIEADLRLGRHSELVGELEALIREHPTRERLRGQLMLALYRCGRQAEALDVYRDAYTALVEDFGLQPGPELEDLQRAILRHDESLTKPRGEPGTSQPRHSRLEGEVLSRAALSPALLEREAELDALARAMHRSRAGEGQLIFIEGPAGIGKSQLLSAARNSAEGLGMRVAQSRASEFERPLPFGIARQLFEPALAQADDDERARLLGGAAGLATSVLAADPSASAGAVQEPFSAFHGLYWLTANAAARRPLALLVDDLHWADEPSGDWLGYLARRIDALPVCIVCAARVDEPSADLQMLTRLRENPIATTLNPRALGKPSVAQLLENALGGSEPAFVEACLQATRGNPFLLRELIAALRERAVSPVDAQADEVLRLPVRNVSRFVLSRLTRLSTDAATVAQAVAVLGESVTPALVRSLSELDEPRFKAALDKLLAAELLTHPAGPRFVHPLVRSAVYQELPTSARSAAHGRAARLLHEHGDEPERIATHLLQTEADGAPETVTVMRDAAQAALERGAPGTTITYLRWALADEHCRVESSELLATLGDALSRTDSTKGVPELRQALALADDPADQVRIALLLGRVLTRNVGFVEAVAVLEQTRERLTASEPALAARIEADAIAAGLGDVTTAGAARARLASAVASDVDPATSRGAVLLAAAALTAVTASEAVAFGEQAMSGGALFAEEQSVWFAYAAHPLAWADRLDQARQIYDAVVSIAGRRGSRTIRNTGLFLRCDVHLRAGALPEAEADALAAAETMSRGSAGVPYLVAFAIEALLERDKLEAAAAFAEPDWLPSIPPGRIGDSLALHSRAKLRARQGRRREALADAIECGRRLDAMDFRSPALCPWRSTAALLLATTGDLDEAKRLANAEVELGHRWGTARALGVALRTQALLAPEEQRPALLATASETLEPSPARLELAKTLLELGAAHRRSGNPRAARPSLRNALNLAHAAGATSLAARAHSELLAAGAKPRRPQTLGVASLTSSELRVARMAAAGQTNRDIAEALFVTEKTVEQHLSHCYRKLAIHDRTQLADNLQAVS